MNNLHQHVEALVSCRNRQKLGKIFLSGILSSIGRGCAVLSSAERINDSCLITPIAFGSNAKHAALTEDADQAEQRIHCRMQAALLRCSDRTPMQNFHCERRSVCAVSIHTGSRATSPDGYVSICTKTELSGETVSQIQWFSKIYSKYLGLLNYSETDSLTKLANRKTFDATFDEMVSPGDDFEEGSVVAIERRFTKEDHWLAVIDIDHFKRVNDTFGHLYGDEVLLRTAGVMRKSFRLDDKLFRFGGEEFVVLLKAGCERDAITAADRFRLALESYEFPQVGHVTCSIGLARIDSSLPATDIIGRADEALYFCKQNGRNQAQCWESLVEFGKIKGPETKAPGVDQAAIDALFG